MNTLSSPILRPSTVAKDLLGQGAAVGMSATTLAIRRCTLRRSIRLLRQPRCYAGTVPESESWFLKGSERR